MVALAYRQNGTIDLRAFEEVTDLVWRLRRGESFFVNFEACQQADRAINFINGAICAIDGECRRFSDSVYFYVGRLSE